MRNPLIYLVSAVLIMSSEAATPTAGALPQQETTQSTTQETPKDILRNTDQPLDDWIEHALRFNPRRDRRLLRRSLLYNMRQLPDGSLTWKSDRRRTLDIESMGERLAQLRERILPEILCPTLIVRGGESDVFFDEDAERFANALPNASWVRVEGAGHSIQGDRPGALVEEIRLFLASLD